MQEYWQQPKQYIFVVCIIVPFLSFSASVSRLISAGFFLIQGRSRYEAALMLDARFTDHVEVCQYSALRTRVDQWTPKLPCWIDENTETMFWLWETASLPQGHLDLTVCCHSALTAILWRGPGYLFYYWTKLSPWSSGGSTLSKNDSMFSGLYFSSSLSLGIYSASTLMFSYSSWTSS